MKCPYCKESSGKENIIDTGHSKMGKYANPTGTKNIYLCPCCLEVFEAFQKDNDLLKPVDIYFDRKFQYCRGNLEKAEYWKF